MCTHTKRKKIERIFSSPVFMSAVWTWKYSVHVGEFGLRSTSTACLATAYDNVLFSQWFHLKSTREETKYFHDAILLYSIVTACLNQFLSLLFVLIQKTKTIFRTERNSLSSLQANKIVFQTTSAAHPFSQWVHQQIHVCFFFLDTKTSTSIRLIYWCNSSRLISWQISGIIWTKWKWH